MHFVVVGAGYTGLRVILSLPAGKVTALSRSPVEGLLQSVAFRHMDLDHPSATGIQLPSPCTILYTVAPGTRLPDPRLGRLLHNICGDVRRIVYLSTTGVYGDCGGTLVAESDPPNPQTERAKHRLAAEELLSDWCCKNGVECVVLRVPGIYGPNRLGLLRIETGEPCIRETDANPGNRIHVDDLAAVCVRVMTSPAPAGIYNVGDGDHRSATWFSQTVAVKGGFDPLPEVSRDDAFATFSKRRLSFLVESRRIDTTKMRRVLAFEPCYQDAEVGIRASLE